MGRSLTTRPLRRIVVKVGSAVLARHGVLDRSCVARLVHDIHDALAADNRRQIVLVSSGAVASGFRSLGLARPPKSIADKQAAAAVGQPRLMAEYAAAFAGCSPARIVGQVLLTAEDIDHRARFLNARHTLDRLLRGGAIPVINENDSVSYAEIKLGDNDRLSSLVASLVDADALIVLSSVAGVLHAGSKTRIVPEIRSLSEALTHVAPGQSEIGTGGMATKVASACHAAGLGIAVVVASGDEPSVIRRVLEGEPIGTFFPPAAAARSRGARQRWIGFSARPKGVIVVDSGAKAALTGRNASLLPSGISAVQGEFAVGALVELQGQDHKPFGRGLTSYSASELARIRGRKAAEIEGVLGYRYADEVIHRSDLVLIKQEDDA